MKAIVLEHGQGEKVQFLDNDLRLKTRPADGTAWCAIEAALPAGSHTPFHRHHDEDEAWYVLEGKVTFFLEGGRTVVATAGTYVHAPKGVAHGFRVDEAVRMLVICGPNGFGEFAREASGPPDMDKLATVAKKYNVDLLGPLPA